ncbi:hypothetical protein [Paenibacillus amylolyticus]|uniref:hypothetical protein n=1 Tax=Paenibacillus amylolyticus TaxID=1451 RepID=UPI0015C50AB1|nr:hypothetical protein [Paenibacillus amylolyticus]
MDGVISDFFREHYNSGWTPAEQVEFLIELFSNLSLHVRPAFPSDEKMVLVTTQMMEEALKRRKIKVDFGEVDKARD